MKQIFGIVVFLLLLAAGCADMDFDLSNPLNVDAARKVAFESLSETEKASLTISWKNAMVVFGYYKFTDSGHTFVSNSNESKCFLPINANESFRDMQYLGAVVFQTKDDSLLGPIIVIIDSESNRKVGFVGRQ